MKSPRAMRYNDLMESATTRGLPNRRYGRGEPLVVLPGVSDSLRARARNAGELSFELRGLAVIPSTALKIFKGAPHDLYEQRRRKFDRVAPEFLAS